MLLQTASNEAHAAAYWCSAGPNKELKEVCREFGKGVRFRADSGWTCGRIWDIGV